MAILSYSQQQAIKPISANNQSKYAQIEKEVEENELRRLLGVAFLQAVQTTPGDYTDLLDGDDFENYDGDEISHKGLRYVISYMVFSRYLGESNVVDTFSGFVSKNRTDAETISDGSIRRLQEENRQLAMVEWELIREYLDINSANYPLWKSTYKKVYRPRIYGVRKVSYGK
jgi:hypothetical protein